MKKFLLVLALAIPFGVNAMATSETFDIEILKQEIDGGDDEAAEEEDIEDIEE